MKTKAEIGVMHLKAKDCWQPPEARDRFPFKVSGRNQPFPHPDFELLAS